MRRVLVLFLALALALLPAAAVAGPPTGFRASGNICLTGEPAFVLGQPTPVGLWVSAAGEELSGTIGGGPWGEGTQVTVVVTQERSLFRFDGSFSGSIAGRFTIGSASGELTGTVSGFWDFASFDGTNLLEVIDSSSAQVRWTAQDSGTKARGTGDASFAVVEGNGFCGGVTFTGVFK